VRRDENYTQMAKRLARVLREKLTEEEFLDLLDIDGDYTTSDWFYKALLDVAPKRRKP
jgi:hypothetical protein